MTNRVLGKKVSFMTLRSESFRRLRALKPSLRLGDRLRAFFHRPFRAGSFFGSDSVWGGNGRRARSAKQGRAQFGSPLLGASGSPAILSHYPFFVDLGRAGE